jgi:hypothetical protein
MVNQKVLGQTTLFADTPAADFPPATANETSPPLASPTLAVTKPAGTSVNAGQPDPAATIADSARTGTPGWLWVALVFVSAVVLWLTARWTKPRV